MLWFDVESRYKATHRSFGTQQSTLWFDVESRYKATPIWQRSRRHRCGLM